MGWEITVFTCELYTNGSLQCKTLMCKHEGIKDEWVSNLLIYNELIMNTYNEMKCSDKTLITKWSAVHGVTEEYLRAR